MRTDGLRRNSQLFSIRARKDKPAARNGIEAVNNLAEYWNTIWNRTTPDHNMRKQTVEKLIPEHEQYEWEDITPTEIQKLAKAKKYGAAGADGWTMAEVASMTKEMHA